MRANEIKDWLVKVLEHGATELVDAEIAKHIVRVFELSQPRYPSLAVLNMDGAGYEIEFSTLRQLRARSEGVQKAAAPEPGVATAA